MPEEPRKFSLTDGGGKVDLTLPELREVTNSPANWFAVLQVLCGAHTAVLNVKDKEGESHQLRIHDRPVIDLGRF